MTQKEALDLLMMGKNIYLTGQAGSGKTYLLNIYINFLKKNKVGVAITASTGIAATHLNGSTIHSWSAIGIKNHLNEHDLSKIAANVNTRTRIQAAKVLIIDEISMLHSYRLDLVNQVCKKIKQNAEPFGGLQVILCGDFFQLPPINEKDYPDSSFAFKSASWEELDLTICYLDEQHRQLDDEFLKVLNEIRSREVSEYTFEKLSGRLNKIVQSSIKPTKLYTHNADVDAINNFELEKINKPEHIYEMTSKGKKDLIEVLKKGCLAPEALVVKEGAMVMFIKNNHGKGYANGTLGKVIGFDTDNGYPIIETYFGREIVASPTSWQFEENDSILAEINQIPLRLAWAITIHKSQGMSLDAAEIDLSKSFAYGMGYVALSRVRTLDGIKLLGMNATALLVDEEIGEIDIVFSRLSNQSMEHLKSLGQNEISRKQKEYLEVIIPKDQKTKSSESIVKELFYKFFGTG